MSDSQMNDVYKFEVATPLINQLTDLHIAPEESINRSLEAKRIDLRYDDCQGNEK